MGCWSCFDRIVVGFFVQNACVSKARIGGSFSVGSQWFLPVGDTQSLRRDLSGLRMVVLCGVYSLAIGANPGLMTPTLRSRGARRTPFPCWFDRQGMIIHATGFLQGDSNRLICPNPDSESHSLPIAPASVRAEGTFDRSPSRFHRPEPIQTTGS